VHPAPCTLLPAPCVNSIERSGSAEKGLGNLIRRRSWKSRPKPKASRWKFTWPFIKSHGLQLCLQLSSFQFPVQVGLFRFTSNRAWWKVCGFCRSGKARAKRQGADCGGLIGFYWTLTLTLMVTKVATSCCYYVAHACATRGCTQLIQPVVLNYSRCSRRSSQASHSHPHSHSDSHYHYEGPTRASINSIGHRALWLWHYNDPASGRFNTWFLTSQLIIA